MAARGSFISSLIKSAAEKGNSLYEELQGPSVLNNAVADWNFAVKDAVKETGKDIGKAIGTSAKRIGRMVEFISPTLDATPGRRTVEDAIDEFLFDPKSPIAPLELMALGSVSGSKHALKGAIAAGKKVGIKVDLGMQALEEGTKRQKQLGRAILKTQRAVAQPRRTIEGAIEAGAGKLQNKAIDEYLDIFKLTTESNPALRRELMDSFPEIRKAAVNWADFGAKLYQGNPTAANMVPTRGGKAKRKVGEAVIKGIDVVEDVFPKHAQIGGGTHEGEAIKQTVIGVAAGRERARRATDKQYRERK